MPADVPAGALQHALDRSPGPGPAGEGTAQLGRRAASTGSALSAPPVSILILFSDTGGGHRAAARALDQALKQLSPSVRVAMLDPLIGQGPALVRQLASLYPAIIQRSRAAWGAVYHSSNTRPAFAAIRAVFGGQVRRILIEQMRRQDPDLVLSVHPLLNHVAHQAIAGSGRPRPLMTVVTDLVDFHRGWAFPRADLVVVPSEGAREVVLKRRVPAARVRLLGLPVDLRFRPPAPGEKQALRRRFGLEEDRMTVLVSGGGEGSGRMLQQVRALAWHSRPWQVIAVCGRNEKLRRRLARVHFDTPTLVLGFVNNMPELMRAADLVVTKAGPGAIAEALASEVPMILTGYLPGQETANVDFVVRSGLGLYAPRPDQLREAVERLLAGGRDEWEGMAERAAQIARPYASLDIAREALALAAAAALGPGGRGRPGGQGPQRAASQARR